ncbi:MAG TPA: UDP-N-acetylmuramate dehydrogenase [Candidatus Baltobacteraceae bacterium]|nr:UDP-N-acetylmuramate dehydrogenase [Candidatus Baltobacteraceae bacterium]
MSLTTAQALASLLDDDARGRLREIFGERVGFDVEIGPNTSWKIGGPADALVVAESEAELAAVMQLCFKRHLPWFVLGSGSNVLVGDGGMRGIVLRLGGAFAAVEVRVEAETVIVEAGASAGMAAVTAKAATLGAAGIGSLAGIPGTVGGSLRMNAGTDREMGDFVREVWVQSPSKPQAHAVSVHYFYRHTTLARDAIVSRVTLAFERGDPKAVRDEMRARLVRRKSTQPIAQPNAGSCFRNPEGDKAARLIEAAGCKGWKVGGAEVSPLHANFINNTGSASAQDVAALLARVRRAVCEKFGVELQLEVHLVGVFVDET